MKHRKSYFNTTKTYLPSEFTLKPTSKEKIFEKKKVSRKHYFVKKVLQSQIQKTQFQPQIQKPFLQQLIFKSNSKTDTFKLPISNTKRQNSKNKHSQFQLKNKTFFNQTFDNNINGNSMSLLTQMSDLKKFKPISLKTVLKQKVQKSALHKFQTSISQQNRNNQNQVNQSHAEALYKLLKTTRKDSKNNVPVSNNMKGHQNNQQILNHIKNQLKQKFINKKQQAFQIQQKQQQMQKPRQFFKQKPSEKQKQQKQIFSQSQQQKQQSIHQLAVKSKISQNKIINKIQTKLNQQKPQTKEQNQIKSKQQLKVQRKQQIKNQNILKEDKIIIQEPIASANFVERKPKIKDASDMLQTLQKQKNIISVKNGQLSDIKQQNNNKKLAQPPKLPINMIKTTKTVPKQYQDEDQLEQINFDNKNKQKLKEKQKQKVKQQQKKLVQKKQQQKKQIEALERIKKQQQNINIQQDSQQCNALDDLNYYLDRIEDVGQYRKKSKDIYKDKNMPKQLIQTQKLCNYYMAHQFYYLSKYAFQILSSSNNNSDFYTVTCQELKDLKDDEQMQQSISIIEQNIQEAKKLLKKAYEQGKSFLKRQQQILLLDGKTNYYQKCCSFLMRQFKLVMQIYDKQKTQMVTKRACYLIQLFFVIKSLNNEDVKQYQQQEQIANLQQHIATYRNSLSI